MSITPTPRITGTGPVEESVSDMVQTLMGPQSNDTPALRTDGVSKSDADPYVHLGSLSVSKAGYGDFKRAENYLSRDLEARTMLHQLEHAKRPITLDIDHGVLRDDQDSYTPATRTIDWNAGLGYKVSGNQSVSPALVLLHEEAHAVGDEEAPKHTAALGATKDTAYENLEEKRVVTGPEDRAATILGEGHRSTHDVDFWFTTQHVDGTK